MKLMGCLFYFFLFCAICGMVWVGWTLLIGSLAFIGFLLGMAAQIGVYILAVVFVLWLVVVTFRSLLS